MASTKRPVKPRKTSKNSSPGFFKRLWLNVYFRVFSVLLLVLFIGYVVYLDITIRNKLEGKIWSLPSQVYARPLELFQGKRLKPQHFAKELELTGYQQVDGIPQKPGQYRRWQGTHFEVFTRAFEFWDGHEKSQALRIDFDHQFLLGLYELFSHQPLDLVRIEPMRMAGIYPLKKEDRRLIKLSEVPNHLVLALLAVEDRRFYQHWGIDPRSIVRAFLANLSAGATVQGGSTLTQQTVKNLFLSSERTLWRKINEAIMALLLEFHYDKALILETYLNEVYLGQAGAHSIHGFSLASEYYFNKSIQQLNYDESALLVGLVKGASWYDPYRHPQRAIDRRNQVLTQMADQGVLTPQQLDKFLQLPLKLAAQRLPSGNHYPAFIDLVKRQLRKDYNEQDLQSEGLRIFTSFDPLVQYQVEQAISSMLPALDRSGDDSSPLQAAAVVASPENGEVLSVVGDRSPQFPGFNRALDASRQVGSLIKPAIYLSALRHVEQYHLATLLDDSPLRLESRDGRIWEPQNYDHEFHGPIPLFLSLSQSRNVPTVRLGLDVGLADIVDTLKDLGVEREVPPYPSITLGAFNLTPFEVAEMYQTLAAKGFHIPLRAIREVSTINGQPLQRYPLKLEQTLPADAVFLLNHILHRVTQAGTASALSSVPVKLAGKTGTSDDLKDSWFAGFSEDRLAVVWLGHDDNHPTGLSGSSGALKVWSRFFSQIPSQDLQMQLPETIEYQWIDPETGGITEKGCKDAVELPFLKGSGPSQRAKCKSRSTLDWLKNIFD
ncbi:MAG: penicillin-binding protein 1B [Gammaproteobacteria bacterium]